MTASKHFNIFVFILSVLIFHSCGKAERSELSDYKFIATINDVIYIDQMTSLLPPDSQRSPYISHERYNNQEYLIFSTSVQTQNDIVKGNNYYIRFKIPLNSEIILNKPYQFKPIQGMETLEGYDNIIYLEGNKQFASISSSNYNINMSSYGDGTVTLSEYNVKEQRVKGKIELSFPSLRNNKQEDIKVQGEFVCWLDVEF